MSTLDNPNPEVKVLTRDETPNGAARSFVDEVFDVVRDIRDPEHPHSLEELSVLDRGSIAVSAPPDDTPGYGRVVISFSPTVPHCSLASIIGLSIQAKLRESALLEPRGEHYYKLSVVCAEGAHASAGEVTKQLADKERVSAAFENPRILGLLRECINNLP